MDPKMEAVLGPGLTVTFSLDVFGVQQALIQGLDASARPVLVYVPVAKINTLLENWFQVLAKHIEEGGYVQLEMEDLPY